MENSERPRLGKRDLEIRAFSCLRERRRGSDIQLNEAHFWIYFRSIERSRPLTQTDLTRAERKRGRKKEEIARGTPNRFASRDICSLSPSLSHTFFALDYDDEDDDDNEEQSIRHFIKRLISRRDFIPSQVA